MEEYLSAQAEENRALFLYANFFAELAKEQRDLIIGLRQGMAMSGWEHRRAQWGRRKYTQLVEVGLRREISPVDRSF